MILILDLTNPQIPILRDEYVIPIIRIVKQTGNDVTEAHLSNIRTIDQTISGLILSGTALADTWYRSNSLKQVLSRWNGPVLGICAGMQMLVSETGGEIIPSLEIGMVPIFLTDAGREDILMKGHDEFSGYALHQYTTTIPKEWTVLAVTGSGTQIIKHQDFLRYGTLFHPEVRNEWIIKRFVEIIRMVHI